MTVELSVVV